MNQPINRKTVLAVLACFCSNSLYAEDESGFYAGYGLTRSSVKSNDFSQSNTEHGLKLGYMFNDRYGLDITATRLADEQITSGSFEADAIALSALTRYELSDNFALYGKLGVARIIIDEDGGFETAASSSTDLFAGIGAAYDFGSLNLFVEFNRFDGDKFEANSVMGGLRFQF